MDRLVPGSANATRGQLDALLGKEPLAIGDLVLIEVLEGFVAARSFQRALEALRAFEFVTIGGPDVAVQAAVNYRRLRALGITARKTIDTAIAARCIVSDFALLH